MPAERLPMRKIREVLRHERLAALGLAGMAKAFDDQLRQPDVTALTFEQRLGLMIDREAGCARRSTNCRMTPSLGRERGAGFFRNSFLSRASDPVSVSCGWRRPMGRGVSRPHAVVGPCVGVGKGSMKWSEEELKALGSRPAAPPTAPRTSARPPTSKPPIRAVPARHPRAAGQRGRTGASTH